jgi:hypothetical protein
MSNAELYSAVSSLPRPEKVDLMRFIVGELKQDQTSPPQPLFIPHPEDHCPYSPEELAEMFRDSSGGVPLSEIWRSLGVQ